MLKKLRKWYSTSHWPHTLNGVLFLIMFIQTITSKWFGGAMAFATAFAFMAICSLSWAMAITLRDTGFFSPVNYLNPEELWKARLEKENGHITIELSPFSPDRPRPSDGSEYYDVSFKISDS